MIALRGLEPVCISWNDNAANSRANSPISSIDRTLRDDRGFVCAMADENAEVEQTQSIGDCGVVSSPIGANRKGSNSEPKRDNELEPFMLITGCGGLYRSVSTDPEGVELGTVPGLIDQAGQLSGDALALR